MWERGRMLGRGGVAAQTLEGWAATTLQCYTVATGGGSKGGVELRVVCMLCVSLCVRMFKSVYFISTQSHPLSLPSGD